MNSKRLQVFQLVVSVVVAILLIVTLIQGRGSNIVRAANLSTESTEAVAGGPGYVMVPATAFFPENPTDGYIVYWGELSVPSGSPNGYTMFNAPVNLPQGATLTGLTMYYRDSNSDSLTLGVDMLRKPLPGTSSGESVGLSVYSNLITFGDYQSDTTPDPTRAVVDNSQYAYWLRVYIYAAPAYLQLQAVRVDYSYNVSLPLVKR